MERRVVITGLGAISPVGNTIADFWGKSEEWQEWLELYPRI